MKSFYAYLTNACSGILIRLLTISLIFSSGCSNRIEKIISSPDKVNYRHSAEEIPYLKLHLKNGDLYMLSDWQIPKDSNYISGTGSLLDINRDTVKEGAFKVLREEIILAETNRIYSAGGLVPLAAMTVITGIFTVVCIANPKACFGSCPTFYANDGREYIVQSEGFSSSISPAFEINDVDALYRVQPVFSNFEIQLRNEAYETHIIKSANVLALRKPAGGRVFNTQEGEFFQVKNLIQPSEVNAPEGDCSEKLCEFDGRERFSTADSSNLAEKEIIELHFNNVPQGDLGLVIASRQTLMTTFLFYQTLAYMGTKAGDWLANLERDSAKYKLLLQNPRSTLGNIDVLLKNRNGDWEKVGELGETGPIATDIKLVQLKNLEKDSTDKADLHIGLRMAKGLWRIDYAVLAEMGNRVDPLIIEPSLSVPEKINSSSVVELLNNPDSALITFPGDKYSLYYQLPDDFSGYELFMESRGYYLEWMRNEWLYEENVAKFYQMLFNPVQYYKDLAPEFKKVEAEMEQTFWSSKYVYP